MTKQYLLDQTHSIWKWIDCGDARKVQTLLGFLVSFRYLLDFAWKWVVWYWYVWHCATLIAKMQSISAASRISNIFLGGPLKHAENMTDYSRAPLHHHLRLHLMTHLKAWNSKGPTAAMEIMVMLPRSKWWLMPMIYNRSQNSRNLNFTRHICCSIM